MQPIQSGNFQELTRRGEARNALAVKIDPARLAAYRSKGDVFLGDINMRTLDYSTQVSNITYDARMKALEELADGIIHGTDNLETMLMIDISDSMKWNPKNGMTLMHIVDRFTR